MKTMLIIITVLLSISLFTYATENQNQLEGTWKKIYGQEIWADTTITYSAIELSGHVKIINKTHFATLNQGSTITPSFFNGGKYEFTKDTYTEHVEFWSSDTTSTYIGRSFTFESTIDGDQWTISGPIEKAGGNQPPWKVHEVRRRIK
jgi:hypothetical protein